MKSIRTRKKIRLDDKYSSQIREYFVTICSHNSQKLFGKVDKENVIMSDAGFMVEKWWKLSDERFGNIRMREYIIMPDHLHGIIELDKSEINGNCISEISRVIQWFKIMSTDEYMKGVKRGEFVRFDQKLWQRSFYDRIIRNETEYNNVVAYIKNNPDRWYQQNNAVK